MTEEITAPKEANKSLENPAGFSGYRIIEDIYEKGLWDYRPNNDSWLSEREERVKDRSEMLRIAQRHIRIAESSKQHYDYELPDKDDLTKRVQRATNQFASYAVKSEILPVETELLTSKITRGSDINFVDNETGALNLDINRSSTSFPKSSEERPLVYISERIIRNRIEYFMNAADDLGIELSPEQSLNAAVFSIAAHEWAHSIERALETRYWEIAKSLEDYDEDRDFWNVLGLSGRVVFDPKIDSTDMPGDFSELDSGSIHRERFATGFEFQGMLYGFIQAGVDTKDANLIHGKLVKDRRARLNDFFDMRERLQMDDLEFQTFTMDLRQTMKEGGEDGSYIPQFPESLGYLSPYNRSLLQTMIEKSMDKLEEGVVKEEMLAARDKQY